MAAERHGGRARGAAGRFPPPLGSPCSSESPSPCRTASLSPAVGHTYIFFKERGEAAGRLGWERRSPDALGGGQAGGSGSWHGRARTPIPPSPRSPAGEGSAEARTPPPPTDPAAGSGPCALPPPRAAGRPRPGRPPGSLPAPTPRSRGAPRSTYPARQGCSEAAGFCASARLVLREPSLPSPSPPLPRLPHLLWGARNPPPPALPSSPPARGAPRRRSAEWPRPGPWPELPGWARGPRCSMAPGRGRDELPARPRASTLSARGARRSPPAPGRADAAPREREVRRQLRAGRPRVPSVRRGKLIGVSDCSQAAPAARRRAGGGGGPRLLPLARSPPHGGPGFPLHPPPWGRGSRSPSRPRAEGLGGVGGAVGTWGCEGKALFLPPPGVAPGGTEHARLL